MKRLINIIIVTAAVVAGIVAPVKAELTDKEILLKLEDILNGLPSRIQEIPQNITRVALYSIRVDKDDVSRSMFRQIEGRIESKFLQFSRPTLIYAPEAKPVRVIATEDGVKFTTSFDKTSKIKELARELRIDGFLEGALFISDTDVFLTLKIFDAETMALVWSQSLDSAEPEKEKARTTGFDFGIGSSGLYLSETSTTERSIPQYAQYYNMDFRLAQIIASRNRLMVTLGGSIYYLGKGINSDTTTAVSSSSGRGSIMFSTAIGLRIPIIQAETPPNSPSRDWLSAEVKFGKLIAVKGFEPNIAGLMIESDLTKNITVGAGLSYAETKDVSYTPGAKVKTGGLFYELKILQFNYKP